MKERALTISRKSESEARPSLSWSIFFIVMSTRSLRISYHFCVSFVVCLFVFFLFNLTPSSYFDVFSISFFSTLRLPLALLNPPPPILAQRDSSSSSSASLPFLTKESLFDCSIVQLFNYFFIKLSISSLQQKMFLQLFNYFLIKLTISTLQQKKFVQLFNNFLIKLSISSLQQKKFVQYSIISSSSSASLLFHKGKLVPLFNYSIISSLFPFIPKEVSFNRAHVPSYNI